MTVMFARTLWRVISSIGRQPVGAAVAVGDGVSVGGGVPVGIDEGAAVGAGVALPRVTSTSSLGQPILPWVRGFYDGPSAQMRIAHIDI